MAYRRRNFRRRRYGRRMRVIRRPKNVAWYDRSVFDVASRALRGVNYIKGLVNAEMFKKDKTDTAANVLNTGQLIPLTDIPIGDGRNERTGLSIFVRVVSVNMIWRWNSASNTPQTVRVALICDKQQIADTTPSYADIYNTNGVVGHLNPFNVGRFSILRSRIIVLNDQRPSVSLKFNLPMRQHVRYNGSDATDIQKCGMYLVFASDQGTANGPSMLWDSRVSYRDN